MFLPIDLKHFISNNLNKNIKDLAFQKNPFEAYDWKWILNQIQAKQKAEKKLPTWFNNDDIVFPSTLSIEQTSSEPLAEYKSTLISGENIIDLTGGFGIDCFYFSQNFKDVTHCEFQEDLSAIVQHNFKVLGKDNIKTVSGDSIAYLEKTTETFDWIYIDPARRDDTKSKVFLLADCTPNVVALQDLLFSKSNNILIKVAPLLDISSILNELSNVKYIYAISLQNEVKELLIVLEKGFNNLPKLIASNISTNGKLITKDFVFEDDAFCTLSLPQKYIYEPFSSFLKIGVYNSLANEYQVSKLHKHSHLYTSEALVNFPGRQFEIEKVIPYNKKEMKQLEGTKCNITTRNFSMKVEEIRKKHKIKEGGETYVFFTTDLNDEKIVIISKKIKTD
ncbi:class I SAM-dependent methyltransferase [Flavobacterium sp. xlx-214]|uniref:THUMP-like domain-containing protein n=1 Tax=unclassified Flavobacterium TaxID=196869 RepID=UPI0013D06C91|nr:MULTISPECIES: class I SAM-dependent methyltransferase [unclassified Flavobacterium]MBA5791808.1 class I SAM-dependent methyltransferase [Flavobacterium sp. xlx-221]QMI83045.1 class I SAM-dependent methyltransferase [Flavobacterium sp. xlx-214]